MIGELVPKTVSLARAERVALLVARPFHWFLNTFRWAIDLLENISGFIVRALGITAPSGHGVAHSTEELQVQIQQARERGLLAPGEEKFILSAIELGQVQVREIMVSRPDMHVLPIEARFDQVMRVFATTQRSRIPVYRETIDHMLGFVHIKDMIWVLLDREDVAARGLMGEGLFEIAGLGLYLIKQPYVLDRDHRLVGEGLDQFDLPVGERPHGATQQGERANRLAFAQQRNPENCPGVAAQSLAFGE